MEKGNMPFFQEGISDERIVSDLIRGHDNLRMLEGIRYYNNDNDVLRRRLYRFDGSAQVEDYERVNKRISHNWHKLLVDQKTAYLVGKPIRFNAEDKKLTNILNTLLGEEFDDTICELVKGAANKGVEWLHVYINENGEFSFSIIPAEQVIPIWDTSLQKHLTGLVRYYKIVNADGKDSYIAEWWNQETVKTFSIDGYGQAEFLREDSHFYRNDLGFGWGRIPFIPFKNNEEMLGDLKFYKGLIDEYDLCLSDFANNLSEVQEVVTILKGYEGTDLREFSDNLRYYKIIKVSGDSGSGVDKLEISIPVEAKKELLDRLEKNIFVFGQGVDVKSDKFSNSTSGIALKFLYSLLDMKVGITERKFAVAIKELLWFLCEYYAMNYNVRYDPKSVAVVFTRRMIENELEQAEIAEKSKGIISDRTIVAHHPWTEDVDDELGKKEQ